MQFSNLIFHITCFVCFQVCVSVAENNRLVNDEQMSSVLRITNGLTAGTGQFPYVVLITYSGRQMCTGSIIHKNWVLTAAHCCFMRRLNEAAVVVGSSLKNRSSTYPVKEFVVHSDFTHIPEFENNGVEYVINDIGLFHLEKSIEFNQYVSPISLPTQDMKYNYGDYASIAGWGRAKVYGMKPSTLQYAMVQLLTEEECKKDWPYASYSNHLCTSTSERKSVCYGDSGGPVVYEGVQVGIICTADTYCLFKKANLHTKVDNYVEWIKEQLSQSDDNE